MRLSDTRVTAKEMEEIFGSGIFSHCVLEIRERKVWERQGAFSTIADALYAANLQNVDYIISIGGTAYFGYSRNKFRWEKVLDSEDF